MHRILLLGFFYALLVVPCHAQKFDFNPYIDSSKLCLRLNTLDLLDVLDGNISIGGEYRFNKTWAITMDAAYIFYSAHFNNCKTAHGVILRPALRLYTGRLKDQFFDVQLHYKEVMYKIDDWIGRDVVNNVPAYEQKTLFRYYKKNIGIQIIRGQQKYISSRCRLEIYLGVGLRFRWQHPYQEPNSIYRPANADLTSTKSESVLPAFPAGIRLVYAIK